jgi:long-chain fatty acid transport protein
MQKKSFVKCVMLGFMGFSGAALASGFQLFEADGAGTGNFYAGGAAEADSASTTFFNPAGLVRIEHPEFSLSGIGIFSRSEFTGRSKWSTTSGLSAYGTYTQTGTAEGGTDSVLPAFDFAMPINNEFYAGFSIAVPFGLSSEYDNNSFVRYDATQSKVQVVDLSPALAFKVTDKLSIGAGPDFDHIYATFDSMSGLPAYARATGRAADAYDSKSENDASGWGTGWHAGVLYQFTPCTRVGLNYRSKVSFTANGSSKLKGPLAGGGGSLTSPIFSEYYNENLTADTTLPASTMLSAYHQINSAWAIMGTVAYTEWAVFDHLTLTNVQGINSNFAPQQITVALPQHFHNTWRFATGIDYSPVANWKLRAGVGYDQNPTVPTDRNIRLPDGNRTALALGAHYQATKAFGIDAGWTHLFFQDAAVSTTHSSGAQITQTVGETKTSADVVGLQLTWDFV